MKSVVHNEAAHRFELDLGGQFAVTEYKRRDGTIIFTHTEVPLHHEGKGIGNALARAALGYARSEGLRVIPRCRFIDAFIRRHPEYQDLVELKD